MNIITKGDILYLCKLYGFSVREEQYYDILEELEELYNYNIEYNLTPFEVSDFLKKFNNHISKKFNLKYSLDENKLLNIILGPIVKKINKDNEKTSIDELVTIDNDLAKYYLLFFILKVNSLKNNVDYECLIQTIIWKNITLLLKYTNTLKYEYWCSKEEPKIRFHFLNYFDTIPNFLKFIYSYLWKYVEFNLNDFKNRMNEIKDICEIIDEKYKVCNIYELQKKGKIEITKIFDNFNIYDVKEIFYEYINFVLGIKFYEVEELNSVTYFIEIIIGYIAEKNKKILNKINNDFFKTKSISCNLNKDEINALLNKNKDNFFEKQLLENFNLTEKEINKYKMPSYLYDTFEESSVINDKFNFFYNNIFLELLSKFLNKYYLNRYDKNFMNKIENNYYWKRHICFLCENLSLLNEKKEIIEKFIYKYIYISEMNNDKDEKNIQYIGNPLNENVFDILEKKEIIYDSYDKNALSKEIKKHFIEFKNIEFGSIDPLVFVDNNLLSSKSRLRFSYYEQMGDVLYKIIILDFMLDGILKYKSNYESLYLSANFQNKLCSIININKIIKTNGLHFGKENAYNEADYLEALIYELYRTNGYYKTKLFIQELLISNDSISENKKINSTSKCYKCYEETYNLLDFKIPKLSFQYDGTKKYDVVYSLITQLVYSTNQLIIINNNFKKGINNQHEYVQRLFFPDDYNEIGYYWSLYALFTKSFEEYYKCLCILYECNKNKKSE